MKKSYKYAKVCFVFCLILSVIFSLYIPASAAEESTVSDQVTIPAGLYRWHNELSNPSSFVEVNSYIDITIPFRVESNGAVVDFPTLRVAQVDNDRFSILYVLGDAGLLTAYSIDGTWEDESYQTITVTSNTDVDASFATWFNSNCSNQITPEPEPTQYIISAGYYKARDTFSTSGWNVSNDSIVIRYYNDAINIQDYVVAEGIAFLIQNDAVEIYYADKAVYTDGWNIDGAKNIQVLQDISVDSDFYTVFNNIFESSSQGTNEFESGYAAGYADGFQNGRDAGYTQGYYDGMAESSGNFFTDILGSVLGALDSFTIFGGFSLLDLLTTLLGGMALIWILKLLAGG